MTSSENQQVHLISGKGSWNLGEVDIPSSKERFNLLTIGLALVSLDQRVLSANTSFAAFVNDPEPDGKNFYKILGDDSEIDGPDFCPLATVRRTHRKTLTSIHIGSKTFELAFSPDLDDTGELKFVIVEMRDVTELREVNETLRRLLEIGAELADLSSEEVATISPEDRLTLLRVKIENGLRSILNYDICEIRLLEESTGRLLPLLAFGLSSDAASRELVASSNNNGITGYVAHNKVCYYCEETIDHPFYLQGAIDARCSLTVPLLWHDKVIGTCNVESTIPGVFNERDLYYLQIFMRDVAAALHTFNLLTYEKEFAVISSLSAVVGSISAPIDTILQETSVLMDEFLDQDPEAIPTLRKILENARVIKDQITLVRRKMTTGTDADSMAEAHPLLNRRRILVVDREREILQSAHAILEEYNCIVETAPDALVALKMLRCSRYDAVICEIKPEGGMSGFQFMLRMIELFPNCRTVPLLLTTGFGYDPGHTLVKAKQQGLIGVLFKPFIQKQILGKLEEVINICGERDSCGNLIPAKEIDGEEPSTPIPSAEIFSSEPSSDTLHQGGSFCQKQGEGRFKKWMDQISELRAEAREERPKDFPSDTSSFDAT